MGEKINSFTKLHAWQASHQLVLAIFSVCEPFHQYDVLRNQIERSALSISSNIAEGFGRETINDKKHFYIMARGSAYELQNQLLIAKDTNKISKESFELLANKSLNSIKLIHGLIRSINGGKHASS